MDVLLLLDSILGYVEKTLRELDSFWAFVLFCPLVLYEVIRYFLPVPLMGILRLFGQWHDDSAEQEKFMQSEPMVSIVIAGRNEAAIIGETIESLLALPYKKREIIVVDDNSNDGMYEICRAYEQRGEIRLLRNTEASGRVGRPVASNLGLYYATGEFVISLDADTTYDRNMIQAMIGPFYNPKVGVVAGNLKVANMHDSIWTVCQAMEYAVSIGVWKRWTSYRHVTLQASGAFGAFRRTALAAFGGWDPELAEDADLSLKMRRSGWDIAFAPYAIAMTHAPASLKALAKQRVRWDKGAVRTYFHKHKSMMMPKKGKWRFALELIQEFFMIYMLPLTYVVYSAVLIYFDWKIWVFAQFFCYFVYCIISFCTFMAVLSWSERSEDERFMLLYIPFFPIYKEIFRWVRIYANLCETFRVGYKEPYLPESGYYNPPW